MLSKPSFMTPPRVRSRSSAWLSTALSNIRQYSSARRMISALTTGEPSSVKATAPPSTRPPISASSVPCAALGDGADGKDVGVAGPLGLEVDELGRRLAVEGRLGVRHAGHRRDAAGQRRRRAGGDGLVLLAARLAQVDVHVDQAGADDLARGVDGACRPAAAAAARCRGCWSPRIHRSATWSRFCDGSMTRPLVMRRVFMRRILSGRNPKARDAAPHERFAEAAAE